MGNGQWSTQAGGFTSALPNAQGGGIAPDKHGHTSQPEVRQKRMHKILIVEDEAPLRCAYEMILKVQAYVVQVAGDGQEALDKCANEVYDLILLDLMMPNIDGLGFLEQFNDGEHEPTKIIVLSNLSDTANLDRAMALGALRALLKADLSPKQLLAAVQYELEV